ncbi:putative transcription regulator SWI/SNF-BAF60b family [Dioscorea sansibarensis]
MVSDADLVGRLREFLRTSDLSTTTNAIVRRRLEEDFGIDLSSKKAFIREQVDLFLQSELNPDSKSEVEEPVKGEDEGDADGEVDEDEEEEEEEEEEEDSSNGRSGRKRKSNKLSKETKRRGGGFTKVCRLSPQLQMFIGVSELARTEVVKRLWAYIRENNLQDPSNRRRILCDEKLQNLFNVNAIDMFQMNKALAKHIWPLDSVDGPADSTPKEKQQKKQKDEGPAESSQKEKQHKKQKEEDSDESPPKAKGRKGGGFLAPLQLSDALIKFIGTGESALSRSDVVKRIWNYIKENKLQDPADRRNIICDEKLQELFNVDSFHGFTVSKLLTAHFVKAED